jgi:undecaprenyl diphosphate synthase
MKYKLDNFHPDKQKIPKHIGIIPDGTRRWAKKHNMSYFDAYMLAMNQLTNLVDNFFSYGTGIVSIYFSSTQNFDRSASDVEAFCQAESIFCKDLIHDYCVKHQTKVVVAGNRSLIPSYFLQSIDYIQKETDANSLTKLYLCVAYNPLEELAHAFSQDKENFLDHLWVKEPVDIVIRTDVNLLSNFLPIQSGFARLYFIENLFNDTKLSDYMDSIEKFSKIERAYGT